MTERNLGMQEQIERALDAALIVLKNGGSTANADRTFHNLLTGYNLTGVSVVWRLDFVAVNTISEGRSLSLVRPVGAIGINLARVSEAQILGERVTRGDIDIEAVRTELERIKTLPPSYSNWFKLPAGAGAGAFFSQSSGGDSGAFVIAFVSAGVGQYIRLLLLNRKLAVVYANLVGAVISLCMAGFALRLGLSQTAPQLAIASVIYMIPGLMLMNGFADTITHKYLLIGLERIANAALLFLVLAVAIAFASAIFM